MAQRRVIREAGRRREAASLLRLVAATAGYTSHQLGNGLTPAQARQAAVEAAGELEAAASSLRRLARPPLAERKAMARLLAGTGMSWPEMARRLGVCERTAHRYTGRL